ncbi:DUF6279 family lipoprotein [Marinobacter nauticus]
MRPASLLRPTGRLFGLVAVAALLVACSSTRTAYRFADWGIVWWVEDYVTLTSAQQTQLEQDLNALRDWHCSAELPRYTLWLETLKVDMAAGVPEVDTIRYHQRQFFVFTDALLQQAVPVTVNLLSTLSDEQVQELATNMAEQHRELEREMLAGSADENAKARAERTRERLESWLGPMNKQQRALVAEWSADRGQQTEIWLNGRRNWQKALLETLEDRNQPGFAAQIENLMVNYDQARGEKYQAMSEESRAAMTVLIHDLLVAGGPEHRQHIFEKAGELNGDFSALTCL